MNKKELKITEKDYFPVYLDTFIVNQGIDFDLYIFNKEKGKPVLFSKEGSFFLEEHRKSLIKNRIEALFVPKTQQAKYLLYIERHLSHIIDSPKLGIKNKTNFIFDCAENIMENTVQKPDSPKNITRSFNFVKTTALFVSKSHNYFALFRQMMKDSNQVDHHAVNVCLYSLSLARRMMITSFDALTNIAFGALMMDLGMIVIPKEIVNKQDPLEDVEWNTLKRHPEATLHFTNGLRFMNKEVEEIIKYHHERLDGSGYPEGLKEEEIPLHVRIVMVADIFESINSGFPFRETPEQKPLGEPIDLLQTFEVIIREFEGKLDFQVLRELVLLLKKRM